ncbi:Translation initiation factor 2, beta subunit (eIF-2beta) [Pseudoloma neurophilia]|uniref:Translation initiation factor 2, beta subunit (EIF-2beta) n=1 Tax=Pseudoloma neurophilia TaxID=146866 RepID=A0A0R0LRJ1_9MICR|nr:Translation initiation factor 2, beta subunit (eIF-2beta) [Pseudoloma neurophilia]
MPSSSSEDSSSEESDFDCPIGFDPSNILKQRDQKFPTAKSVLVRKKETETQHDIPEELKYENLLKRAVHILKNNDNTQAKIKLPLEVKREYGNKTVMNLVEIAKILKRDPEHIKKYLFSELTTSGSVNAKGQLIMKGNFTKTKIQDVLRLYIEYFMVCTSCDAVLNTQIVKENRMYNLKCFNCGATKYVGNIVEGFKSKGKVNPKLRGLI